MIDQISSIGQIPIADAVRPAGQSGASEFRNLLDSAIRSVDTLQDQSTAAVDNFLRGETEDIHSTVLATQRAEIAFELFQQVRNKAVAAYQEVMRMQL